MSRSFVSSGDLSIQPRLEGAGWPALWISGDATALEPPLVAIIGTRQPDADGVAMARALSGALVARELAVVSGGALGIDAAVHSHAVELRGRTVVVLPCGLDHYYPQRHRDLYARILDHGGALISPFPPETPPARWTFPRRNALLAALCDLLVVVQAPSESGSLITADDARKLGRRVLVVPASPGDPRGGGCLRLLRAGAEVCTNADDLFAALARRDGPLLPAAPVRVRPASRCTATRPRAARASAPPPSPAAQSWVLDGDPSVVYTVLGLSPLHLDQIATQAKLSVARIRSALLHLVLLGAAVDHGDGLYARSP